MLGLLIEFGQKFSGFLAFNVLIEHYIAGAAGFGGGDTSAELHRQGIEKRLGSSDRDD